MAHGDAFRNPTKHARAGKDEPARWNMLCMPKLGWLAYPNTAALANDPDEVTCHICKDLLAAE